MPTCCAFPRLPGIPRQSNEDKQKNITSTTCCIQRRLYRNNHIQVHVRDENSCRHAVRSHGKAISNKVPSQQRNKKTSTCGALPGHPAALPPPPPSPVVFPAPFPPPPPAPVVPTMPTMLLVSPAPPAVLLPAARIPARLSDALSPRG